jgi:hypothetical protein
MAFEEIKARLGLDITSFERGLSKAQKASSGVGKKIQQEFAGGEKLGGALTRGLATAFGLSIENISQKFGSFLENKLAGQSRSAIEQIAEDSAKAAEALDKRLADINEKRRKQDAEDARAAKEIADEKAGVAKTERDIIFDQQDAAGQLEILEQEILDALKDKINAQAESAEYYSAEKRILEKSEEKRLLAVEIEKNLAEAVSDVVEMLGEASDAEKTRTDELAKQTAELKKQGRATEDNMKAQRRQAELPTMADVISGKRNIGSVGKNRATKLERDREKAARLSDAEQRAREAFSGATTESARAAALENGRRIRAQLDATRGQIANAEGLLTTRVADANPYAAMEKELGEIKGQLKTLNETTLAPTKIK